MFRGRYELHVSAFQPRAQRGGLEFLRAVDSDLKGRAENGEERRRTPRPALDRTLCRSPRKRGNCNETAELLSSTTTENGEELLVQGLGRAENGEELLVQRWIAHSAVRLGSVEIVMKPLT